MKGIILAGGSGTRLYPITKSISKQILPIYDKPMIYYPMAVLMLAGIREILIISTPRDMNSFKDLFGLGHELGLNISYAVQDQPNGIAEAFIIGESFIGDDHVALILGDNVFYGQGLVEKLHAASVREEGATVFGYHVSNPKAFGVVTFDKDKNVIAIDEKPEVPKSKYAVPGLYFYDNEVIEIAKQITPSDRGELEITSINQAYLKRGQLKVEILGRGMAWLDTGTHKSLLNAANFVETVQTRQGLYIASLEEIAYRQGFISKDQLIALALPLKDHKYGQYLLDLVKYKK